MTDKIEKLKKLLEVANDGLSRSDFEAAFKSLIDFIKKTRASLEENNNRILQELKDLITSLNEQKLGEAQAKIDTALADQAKSLNFMRDWVRGIKNGKDGRDGRDGIDADVDIVAEKAQKLTLDAILPQMANNEQIAKILSELERIKAQPLRGRVGGGFSKIHMDSHLVDDETPSGTVNGVTTDFTIANIPNPSTSLKVYVNGQRMRITEDYTLSKNTISFLTAPPTGSILLVDYRT